MSCMRWIFLQLLPYLTYENPSSMLQSKAAILQAKGSLRTLFAAMYAEIHHIEIPFSLRQLRLRRIVIDQAAAY